MPKRLYKQFNVYRISQGDAFTVIATSPREATSIVNYVNGPGRYSATCVRKGEDMTPAEMRDALDDADFTTSDGAKPKYDDFDLLSDLEGKYSEV